MPLRSFPSFLTHTVKAKNGECKDFANARLTIFCQNIEKIKLQEAKGKKEEAKEAKKDATPAADTDFTQVRGGDKRKQKQGRSSTKSGRGKAHTAWAEHQLPEDTSSLWKQRAKRQRSLTEEIRQTRRAATNL